MAKHAHEDSDRIEVDAVVLDEAGGPVGQAPRADRACADESADEQDFGDEAKPAPIASPLDSHGPALSAAEEVFPYPDQRKSRRTRKVLIALIIVVVIVIAAGIATVAVLSLQEGASANKQAMDDSAVSGQLAIGETGADDAVVSADARVEVVNVASLLGLSRDDAIAQIGHGAQVTAEKASEEDSEGDGEDAQADDAADEGGVATLLTVSLQDDPSDTLTGVPTVYLGLDGDGAVVEASYSAGLSQLGYAAMRFADAVGVAKVVDQTLSAAGITVDSSAISLPEDAASYTTYDTDGTTVLRENCSFTGSTTVSDAPCTWTADLAYDYSAAHGDVTDAVRRITVTVERD